MNIRRTANSTRFRRNSRRIRIRITRCCARHARCFFWEAWGIWFLSRYEDNVAALKDARLGREILNVMTREEVGWSPRHRRERCRWC